MTISQNMLPQISFVSCKMVAWNYEVQTTELVSVLKYNKSCGLHGSWLNKVVYEEFSSKLHLEKNIFITLDEIEFSIRESDLLNFLNWLSDYIDNE